MDTRTAAVSLRNVTKTFGAVVANEKVNLDIYKGEILALLGENGSGKTTLMNMLAGIYFPDAGQIFVGDREVTIRSPKDAYDLGIGMIHQHFKLVDVLTVTENIILGLNEKGKLNIRAAAQKIDDICKKYGFDLDPMAKIYDLSVSQKQTVEIVKVLFRGAEILILDEPTAVLTPQETDRLFQVVRNMRADGKAIVLITHKLHEVLSVSDEVAVLRKGKYIGTVDIKNTTKEELSRMMVGRDVEFAVHKEPAKPGKPILEVKGLTVASKLHHNNAVKQVSFNVREGEIVCIAGIDGNGQTELVYGLTGLEPVKEGTVTLCGQDITNMQIRKRSILGMSHIPEDRHKHGLVLDYTLEDNLVLQRYFEPQFVNGAGFLKRKNIRTYAEHLIDQYDVRSGQGPITLARAMSGGNQQKAIIAREIDKDPQLLIAVQPTRGLDVGAIEYIHRQIVAQRDKNKAVLLVSLELDEVMSLSDRILVMYEGEIVGELDPKKTTVEELGLYMAGAKREVHGA